MLKSVRSLGRFSLFVWNSLLWLFRRPLRWRLITDEMLFIGNESLFIVSLAAFFTGAVFAYQSWLAFVIVGTDSMVGATVSLALVRELAPVMAGLVVTGRAGAAMAAQLGNMRVTEQIDALEVMGVSPLQYLISPKLVAGLISLPLLTAIFAMVGNLGGYVVGVWVCGVDPGIYVSKLKYYMDPWDFYHGLIKAAFFGFLLTAISCYQGYRAKNGAQGVGKATNDAVVSGFIMILVLDYFLSILVPTGVRVQ
jgi:phospholipid/cholesterol/gamma-HCH transport system permease protein